MWLIVNSLCKVDRDLIELCYVWDELTLDEQAEIAIIVAAEAWPKMAPTKKAVIVGYLLLGCAFMGLLLVAVAHQAGAGSAAWIGWVFLAGAVFGALLMLLTRK